MTLQETIDDYNEFLEQHIEGLTLEDLKNHGANFLKKQSVERKKKNESKPKKEIEEHLRCTLIAKSGDRCKARKAKDNEICHLHLMRQNASKKANIDDEEKTENSDETVIKKKVSKVKPVAHLVGLDLTEPVIPKKINNELLSASDSDSTIRKSTKSKHSLKIKK